MLRDEELVKRLDRIESKLDIYLEKLVKHDTDIEWLRHYLKISLSAVIAVAVGLITTVLNTFIKPN